MEIAGWGMMTAGLTKLFSGFWESFMISLVLATCICVFLFSLFTYIFYQFRIGWGPMMVKLASYSLVVTAAIVLHDYLVNIHFTSPDVSRLVVLFLISFVVSAAVSLITRVFKLIIK